MQILNKWEVQQIAFNHSSDIGIKDVMNRYEWYLSCIRSSFTFQKEPFKKNIKSNHDDKIKYEILQYDIHRDAAKISANS